MGWALALRNLSFSASALVIGLALSGCKGNDCPPGTEDPDADGICTEIDTDVDPVGAANILVDPCDFDYGAIAVDGVVSQSFSIFNKGSAALTVTGITTTTPEFPVVGTPVKIGAGSQYRFAVRFEPTSFGTFSDTLTITSDDPDAPTITCNLNGAVLGDVDEDGFIAAEAGGDDCDDTDPNVYPGAHEVWYDGTDADCSGGSDFDQDGDGYESKVFNPNPAAGGGDCQDVNTAINPAATDKWYDGVDSDCSGGSDFDQDGDGYDSTAFGGEDCNDEDPLEGPDGSEVFDGHDNDCNGMTDDGITADVATATIYGTEVTATGGTGDMCGSGVAAGDFDGNGDVDLVIGCGWDVYVGGATGTAGDAAGALAIFNDYGWVDGDVTETNYDNYIKGAGTTDEFGTFVANVGDVDGDGYEDLAASATAYSSKRGRVYVFSGPDVAGGVLTDAVMTVTGNDDYQLGTTISSNTDLNADGYGDLILFGKNSYNPYVYLAIVYGEKNASGTLTWESTDSYFVIKCGDKSTSSRPPYCGAPGAATQGGSPYFARAAQAEHNLDGDGYPDLLLGDALYDEAYKQDGKAWALWGKSSAYNATGGDVDVYATTLAKGKMVKNYIGAGVGAVPDYDGDGDDELMIKDGDAETIYLLEGDSATLRAGNLNLSAKAVASFESKDEWTGTARVGDGDGDGVEEFGLMFGEDGTVYLFNASSSEAYISEYDGTNALSLGKYAAATLGGGTDSDQFGWSFVPHEIDVNGDGTPDLVIGDNKYKDSSRGAVHIFER